MSLYLDLETDSKQKIIIIGLYARSIGFVQLVGEDITRTRLLHTLPDCQRMYTFNGHSADLPVIRKRLRLNLANRYQSVDLMHVCRAVGLTGGQKVVERRVGFRRARPPLTWRDVHVLWELYVLGRDSEALPDLLRYNREDIKGIIHIRSHLRRLGVLK